MDRKSSTDVEARMWSDTECRPSACLACLPLNWRHRFLALMHACKSRTARPPIPTASPPMASLPSGLPELVTPYPAAYILACRDFADLTSTIRWRLFFRPVQRFETTRHLLLVWMRNGRAAHGRFKANGNNIISRCRVLPSHRPKTALMARRNGLYRHGCFLQCEPRRFISAECKILAAIAPICLPRRSKFTKFRLAIVSTGGNC